MSACRRCGNNDGLGHHICVPKPPVEFSKEIAKYKHVSIHRPRDRENAYVPKLVAWINEDPYSFAEKNHGTHFVKRGRADVQGHTAHVFPHYEEGKVRRGATPIPFAIECKKPGQHPTELQYQWADNFRDRGGQWTWVESLEEGKAAVKRLRSHGWFPSKSTSTTGRSSNSARRKRASTSRSSKASGK